MNVKASAIVSAIEHATRHMRKASGGHEAAPLDPNADWSAHCSQLFRETLRQLRSISGQYGIHVKIPDMYVDENKDANHLGFLIRSHISDWTSINVSQAQSLANSGHLVVASLAWPKKPDGTYPQSGHLAFVYPVQRVGDSPQLRDGNIHPNVNSGKPGISTYGAVSMSRVFSAKDLKRTGWFVYKHY